MIVKVNKSSQTSGCCKTTCDIVVQNYGIQLRDILSRLVLEVVVVVAAQWIGTKEYENR